MKYYDTPVTFTTLIKILTVVVVVVGLGCFVVITGGTVLVVVRGCFSVVEVTIGFTVEGRESM